jgi:hypothetical protein
MYHDQEIRLIAYRIWEEEGRPEGRDLEYWFKAEAIWRKMSFCRKCGSKIAEGDLCCSACGTKVERVGPTEAKAPIVSPEEGRVKSERGNMREVSYWAIMSAVVGALCGVAAAPLGVMGLNQEYDFARNVSWSNHAGGMPPGTAIAAIVLSTVSIIFIAVAIALGIYALHYAKKE